MAVLPHPAGPGRRRSKPTLVAACSQWADGRESARRSPTGATQPPFALDLAGGVPNAARALSAPITQCVVRDDTTHPVFHGCVDWHSAVHGNYALRVISRLTNDTKFVDIAQSVISPDGLRSELAWVNGGELNQEIPYGFAWFLILDRESASAEMTPLAMAVTSQLRRWITDHVEGAEFSAAEYQNLSFAVFALHHWFSASFLETRPPFVAPLCRCWRGAGRNRARKRADE